LVSTAWETIAGTTAESVKHRPQDLPSYGERHAERTQDRSASQARHAGGLACRENPAALKYALCLLGLMSANTCLPIVELDDRAKRKIASAIKTISDDEITRLIES
jgi:dihydrodipicolinate synthase/N-acetylneuraminate lyase